MDDIPGDEGAGRPRPAAVWIAGIGSLLAGVCCGACGLLGMATPYLQERQAEQMAKIQRSVNAQFEAQRKQLESQKEQTDDPQAIAQIDRQLAALNAQPFPDMSDAYRTMYPPAVKRTYLAGGIVEILLNGLMVLTGIGLLTAAGWSRPLGNFVGGAKLLGAVTMTILFITVITPAMVDGLEKMQQAMQQHMQNMQGGPGGQPPVMPSMSGVMTGMYVVWAIIGLLIACVWPTTLLVLINLRGSREALSGRTAGS